MGQLKKQNNLKTGESRRGETTLNDRIPESRLGRMALRDQTPQNRSMSAGCRSRTLHQWGTSAGEKPTYVIQGDILIQIRMYRSYSCLEKEQNETL